MWWHILKTFPRGTVNPWILDSEQCETKEAWPESGKTENN